MLAPPGPEREGRRGGGGGGGGGRGSGGCGGAPGTARHMTRSARAPPPPPLPLPPPHPPHVTAGSGDPRAPPARAGPPWSRGARRGPPGGREPPGLPGCLTGSRHGPGGRRLCYLEPRGGAGPRAPAPAAGHPQAGRATAWVPPGRRRAPPPGAGGRRAAPRLGQRAHKPLFLSRKMMISPSSHPTWINAHRGNHVKTRTALCGGSVRGKSQSSK
ncbi:uncharacterized protein LOC141489425 [Macrotis lagotis]|uniref:uncharacterized protein LOC141489425 n=1 Tax=Macrotis lagotis TaxID=92651 RepID=UPI003D695356